MGFRSWIWKKLIGPDIVNEISTEILQKVSLRNQVVSVLEDEEIAGALTVYGDQLYDRYQKKFWGTIGGLQKGINGNGGQMDLANLASKVLDTGELNLASLIKAYFSSASNNGSSLGTSSNGVMT